MSTTPTNSARHSREAGMVAIMTTMILMIVISLIVLGFAQVSRRNERQALDRQLSTQAFYAAETGVNDASEILKTAIDAGNPVEDKTSCGSTAGAGFYGSLDPVIDDNNNVEYTCLLVDSTPPSLVYSSIGSTGTVIPVTAASGNIASLRLTWQSKDGTSTPANNCPTSAASGTLPAASGWGTCGYGVLRFDLVPTAGSTHTLASLQAATMTTFLIPLRPAQPTTPSVNYSTGGANNKVAVSCSNTNCQFTVNFPAPSNQYYLRVRSIYRTASIEVEAFSAINAGGSVVSLSGTQALVDSTGKAEDVLRRIQVRVPLAGSSSNLLSDYAIQSNEAICKRFSVMDGLFTNDADNVGGATLTNSTVNPLCDP